MSVVKLSCLYITKQFNSRHLRGTEGDIIVASHVAFLHLLAKELMLYNCSTGIVFASTSHELVLTFSNEGWPCLQTETQTHTHVHTHTHTHTLARTHTQKNSRQLTFSYFFKAYWNKVPQKEKSHGIFSGTLNELIKPATLSLFYTSNLVFPGNKQWSEIKTTRANHIAGQLDSAGFPKSERERKRGKARERERERCVISDPSMTFCAIYDLTMHLRRK